MWLMLNSKIGFPDRIVGEHLAGTTRCANAAGLQQIGPIDHPQSVASGVEDYYTGGNEPALPGLKQAAPSRYFPTRCKEPSVLDPR